MPWRKRWSLLRPSEAMTGYQGMRMMMLARQIVGGTIVVKQKQLACLLLFLSLCSGSSAELRAVSPPSAGIGQRAPELSSGAELCCC